VGELVRRGCFRDPGEAVIAAYDAPFPNAAAKAGARAFPQLVPLTPDAPGAQAGRRVLDALRESAPPALVLWGESDQVLPVSTGRRFAEVVGAEVEVLPEAGHFVQEDAGEQLGRRISDWLQS
jgi:haloalkane dehalogenase